jgi:hypothetical protein
MKTAKVGKRVVGVGFLISVIVIFRLFPLSSNPNDNTIISGFLEWFGVLLGIIMGLVLVEVWARHSQVNEDIDKEADGLTLLIKTCRFFHDSSCQKRIADSVINYVQNVMNAGIFDHQTRRETVKALDQLHRVVGEMLINPICGQTIAGELLRQLNIVIDMRGDRLSHIKEHVRLPLWLLILGTSLVWLFAFFTLYIENDLIAIFINGGALFTVSGILFIIKDIDNHETGSWRANFDSFQTPLDEANLLLNEIGSSGSFSDQNL